MTDNLRNSMVTIVAAGLVLFAAGTARAAGESAAFKSPVPGMHFTAGLPIIVWGDLNPREDSFPGWPRCEMRWDGQMFNEPMGGGSKIFGYFPFIVPAESVTPGIHMLKQDGFFHTGVHKEITMAVQVDPWPADKKQIELKEDLTATDLDWTNVAVRGNGHTVKVTGKLTIKDSLISGLGAIKDIRDAEKSTMVAGITGTLTGDVTIENSIFEATGALAITIDGEGKVSIRNSEWRASNFIRFMPSNPDNSPVITITGKNAANKLFQGNRIGAGRVVFHGMKNWLIGSGEGLNEADGNILIGNRCTINLESCSNVTIRGNYSYHTYSGTWSQGYNFTYSLSQPGILTEHNLIRNSSWPVQDVSGEFRYNVVLGYGHSWVRTVQAGTKIHHNLFTPEGGGGLGYGIDCYNNWQYKDAGNISIYNNTFDGGALTGDFAGGFIGAISPIVSISSIRNNLFTYARDQQNSNPGKPLIVATEGNILSADYNAFYSPNSKQKSNYGFTIEGKKQGEDGFGGHDVSGKGTVGDVDGRLAEHPFAGKMWYPYTVDEAAVWNRQLKLSQVLAEFRARYTPAAGSPVIDKGDPADGKGVDIGAIGAPGGEQDPQDKLGKYGQPSKDKEPPKVSLPPFQGAATGPVSLTATASDNVAVTGVQFFVDGQYFGDAFAAPFSVSFNSAILTNGEHKFTAKAWDAAGNSTESAPVTLMVKNANAATAPTTTTAPANK